MWRKRPAKPFILETRWRAVNCKSTSRLAGTFSDRVDSSGHKSIHFNTGEVFYDFSYFYERHMSVSELTRVEVLHRNKGSVRASSEMLHIFMCG